MDKNLLDRLLRTMLAMLTAVVMSQMVVTS